MNAGLPGTGIGGLFYLVTALLMPAVEMVRTLRGRSSVARWRIVLRQVTLALGVLGGLWATAWFLKHLLPHQALVSLKTTNDRTAKLFGATPTILTFATLGGVLAVVEFVRLLQWMRSHLADLLGS